MTWIADVVTHTTIRSTWGNTMRDHVVHTFANKAERDSTAVPADGMMCVTLDDDVVWVRRNNVWVELWRPTPRTYDPAWAPVGLNLAGVVGKYRVVGGWCTAYATAQSTGPQAALPTQLISGLVPVAVDLAPGGVIGHGIAFFGGSLITFAVRNGTGGGADRFTMETPETWPIGPARQIGHGWPTQVISGDSFTVNLSYPTTAVNS